jgi:hypothetical protein
MKAKSLVKKYLDDYVNSPALDLMENDIITHLSFPNILVLLKVTKEQIIHNGISFDKEKFNDLTEIEQTKVKKVLEDYISTGNETEEVKDLFKNIYSKKYLIFYVIREMNWALISIMSASYISANILMRSILELLVKYSTTNRGGLKTQIDSIGYLEDTEKKTLKNLWEDLNSWAHPFEHWEKSICPVYMSHKPLFHKTLCEQSLDYLYTLTDFLIIIGLGKYNINISIYKDEFIYNPQIKRLDFLDNKINKENKPHAHNTA